MKLTLNLSSNELDNEDLQVLTRQLCESIINETDITAQIPSGTVQQGHKGDPITLGLITLIIKSGAAVALCEVLKAYFNRPLETIELEKPDGTKLKLTSKTIKLEDVQTFLSE